MKFCIVGAGFSGAVMAQHLAQKGHEIVLIEERSHVAGSCHTSRDKKTGIMLHHYGPHIFHTSHKYVWDYIRHFGEFKPYINRVKAVCRNKVYTLPINLFTINQFFGKAMGPKEARLFLQNQAIKYKNTPQNFEEAALSIVGSEIYEKCIKSFTLKQWGIDGKNLPVSLLKRIPIRYDYNDNYYNDSYQGIPVDGYTNLINNMINNHKIKLMLNTSYDNMSSCDNFDHVIYTGPIDRYFNFKCGRLSYRTLDFERFDSDGDFQGNAVINYCDEDIPYTRICEHKHLAPWEKNEKTIYFREYSRLAGPKDAPYYPIRLNDDNKMLKNYLSLAIKEKRVSFLGRLGTYRYLDMDKAISESISACEIIDQCVESNRQIPSLFHKDYHFDFKMLDDKHKYVIS